jgi:hypothetical protein
MSKGTRRCTVRIGKELIDAIEAAVAKRNTSPGGVEMWTISDWILSACIDKLNHSERSRKSGRKLKVDKVDMNGHFVRRLMWLDQFNPKGLLPEDVSAEKLLKALDIEPEIF